MCDLALPREFMILLTLKFVRFSSAEIENKDDPIKSLSHSITKTDFESMRKSSNLR